MRSITYWLGYVAGRIAIFLMNNWKILLASLAIMIILFIAIDRATSPDGDDKGEGHTNNHWTTNDEGWVVDGRQLISPNIDKSLIISDTQPMSSNYVVEMSILVISTQDEAAFGILARSADQGLRSYSAGVKWESGRPYAKIWAP